MSCIGFPTRHHGGVEPFWSHFEALTRIARPSFGEERAVEHVEAWARQRGYATRRDAAGNLVVAVPASAGREGAPTVVLQGHLDMVCERHPDSPYDPREGRIRLVRDGEWLTAEGTTLGADDGVAIAAMLAVAEDPDAAHGPLELLMTVAEEVGLAGARELDPALITGSLLLNLDSEEDGTLTVGCAGGTDSVLRIREPREPLAGAAQLRVTVSGGRGGHSGGDIAAGRANAIKALARAVRAAPHARLVALDGGASRNAIPRDAAAVVAVAPGEVAAVRAAIEREGERIRDAFRATDPGVRVTVAAPNGADAVDTADGEAAADTADREAAAGGGAAAAADGEAAAGAWSAAATARLLDLLAILPAGPIGMSPDFPGVVETSSSLGVAETEGDRLTLRCLSRSANDAALADVTVAIAAAARLAGAELERPPGYPGWRPDLDSPLLATASAVHARLFGAPPRVTAVHGGLETGLIGAKLPRLDMVSLGPRIEGAHAPGERLDTASAGRFMRLLTALLDELSR
jgi:dipeptidase D